MKSQHTTQTKSSERPSQANTQSKTSAAPARHPMLHLQKQVGNQAVGRLIQAKLTVGEANDVYEQEADRVAAEVVSQIHSPKIASTGQPASVQRQVLGNEGEELRKKPLIQCKSDVGGMAVSPEIESSIQQARGSGQSLAESIRNPMEQAFGADFSGVRVHTDERSDRLNRVVGARAFTTGHDIFFSQGAYQLGSRKGQELIAHELTHVVQQNGSFIHNTSESEGKEGRHINFLFAQANDAVRLQPVKGEIVISDVLQCSRGKTSKFGQVKLYTNSSVTESLCDLESNIEVDVLNTEEDEIGMKYHKVKVRAGDCKDKEGWILDNDVIINSKEEETEEESLREVDESNSQIDSFPNLLEESEEESLGEVDESNFQIDSFPNLLTEDHRLAVYFSRNSSDINTEFQKKINDFFELKKEEKIEIRAFKSEEEKSYISNDRLQNVVDLYSKWFDDSQNKDKSKSNPFTQSLPNTSQGIIHYSSKRYVEIACEGKSEFSQIDKDVKHPIEVEPNIEVTKAYKDAINFAKGMINKFALELQFPLKNKKIKNTLKSIFGSESEELGRTVAFNLLKIGIHLKNVLANSYTCMTKYHPMANSIAFNDRESTPKIWLSPGFKELSSPETALVLIHEAAHSTPDVMTNDFAYGGERMIRHLTADQALKNSDSYALFVREVFMNSSPSKVVIPYEAKPIEDKYEGEISPEQVQQFDRFLATIDRQLIATQHVIESKYMAISEIVYKKNREPLKIVVQLTSLKNIFTGSNDVFNFTMPPDELNSIPVMPTISDIEKLAAIYARIDAIRYTMEGEGLLIKIADTEENIQWMSESKNTVLIPKIYLTKLGNTNDGYNILDSLLEAHGVMDSRVRIAYLKLLNNGEKYHNKH